jgi:hypothetical protein
VLFDSRNITAKISKQDKRPSSMELNFFIAPHLRMIIINNSDFSLINDWDLKPTRRIAMKGKKKSFLEKVEKEMVCIAYAEAGEDCPLDDEIKEYKKPAICKMSLKDAMACSAYAEAGVPCPICEGA